MTRPLSLAGQGRNGRFAPSPTGALHIGHLYSALLAHDRAREAGGQFLIRIEDLDAERCRPAFIDQLLADLAWVGLTSDGPVLRQSTRLALYATALTQLQAMGLLYRCTCTRAEVAAEALSAPHGTGAIYGGRCRHAPPALDDRPFVWRLDWALALARTGPLDFVDAWVGRCVVEARSLALLGDVLLARKDGRPAYHLAVVVDDAAQDVGEVVRGHDLLGATAVHRLLQALLDLPSPRYAHHRLIAGNDGKRLAKRDRPASLADLRRQGADPAVLTATLRKGLLPPPYQWDQHEYPMHADRMGPRF